jgi:hypothetical protein
VSCGAWHEHGISMAYVAAMLEGRKGKAREMVNGKAGRNGVCVMYVCMNVGM